jgi:Abnormal spindle-like microcephaly-assoc'd, ASPM-SPD-2-Hydin
MRLKALGGAAAAAVAALALVAPAQANLALTGPMDPVLAFPAWYQDVNGTRLQLCVGDPGCPTAPPVLEPVAPNDEAFYSLVNADLTGPGGQSVNIMFAIEAAFLDFPVTFGRVQVTMSGMEPNSDYTFTYPYGTAVWTTDANGNMLSGFRAAARHEAGCFAGFEFPCDLTLRTEIGPFLTWDPASSAPPAGYIGDGTTPHTVVGTANNFVRVTGPGLPAGGISTNLFTVEGKLAVAPFPIFFAAPGSGAFGTQRVNTTVTRTVTIKNNGLAPTLPITSTAVSGPGAANYAIGADTCAGTTLASGATCTVDVSFTPAADGALSANLDLIDSGATHSVPLTGTGGHSGLSAAPSVMNFLNQNVSTTGPENTLTLKNA